MRFKDITESSQKCPHCGGPLVEYSGLMEKKDACYYKVKASAKVWPSAYASGRLVQCRKKGAANYGNKSESVAEGSGPKEKQKTPYRDINSPEYRAAADKQKQKMAQDKAAEPGKKMLAKQGVAEDSLNEFAPGAGGDDEAGDDPYKYPKPKRYNRSADYFEQFEADHFDREDFDDDTGVFKGYWGSKQIAYFKFDNPARTGGNNPGMGWYYEPESDGSSDNSTAGPAVDNTDERKQQELSMIRAFLKSGNRPNPDSQIGRLMKKHGLAEGLNDTQKKIEDTINKLEDRLKHAKSDEQWDRIKDRIERLQAGLKRSKQGVAEGSIEQRIAQAKKNNPLRASVAKKTNGYAALVTDTTTGKPSWFGGALWQTPELAMGHAKAFVKGFPYLEQEYAQRFIDKNRNGIVGQGVAEDAVDDFLAKGGKIETGKTHKPRKVERWQGSSHIGAAGGRGSKGTVSGQAANTNPKSNKPVVSAESLGNIKMNEKYNAEYDDEAGMADNNLQTLARAVEGIDDLIQSGDNLPEWCQEKIAVAKSMLVAVWDYMYSEEASEEVDPEIDAMFEAMDQLVHETAHAQQLSVDLVWESFESLSDQMLYETAAWRRKEGKSKKGGLNAKGVASYRRENPGSKLQMAVTTKPSKLKPGSKAAKRRKSFCARMSGVKGPMKKPNGKPTRKALALRKWNC